MNKEELIKSLVESWPGAIVPRNRFHEFTSGAFKPGTLANHDCQHTGPKGRMLIGKVVCYPKAEAAVWVADQLRPLESAEAALG